MYSTSILLPLNLAIIPAAYLYGAGGLNINNVLDVAQWLFRGSPSSGDHVHAFAPISNASSGSGSASQSGYSDSDDESVVGLSQATTADTYICLPNPPNMRPMFISYEPIMVYLENFLTEFERGYLVQLANPIYEPSEVRQYNEADGSKTATVNPSHRLSETAWLPSTDPVVSCVRSRAASFQGHAPNATLDVLAALRYTSPGGKFGLHHDWDSARVKEYDRRTSFFVTLAAEADEGEGKDGKKKKRKGEGRVKGGSTWFPYVKFAWTNSKTYGRPWCQWVDCEFEGGQGLEDWDEVAAETGGNNGGVAVKPIPGNAVFWVNFKEDGTGIHETLHAGEPVISGTKIGMNIWTWSMIGAEGGGIPEE